MKNRIQMSQTNVAVMPRQDVHGMKRLMMISFLLIAMSMGSLVWGQGTAYHLIAGSFKTLKSANNLQDALEMRGYAPFVIFPSAGSSNYRVSIYSSYNRYEVESFKNQTPQAKKYWILPVAGGAINPASGSSSRLPQITPSANRGRGSLEGVAIYHVVIGSFPTRDQALRSQGARQAQGYNAYIVENGTRSYKVAVYKAYNKREADDYKQNLVRSGVKAWVMTQAPMAGSDFRVIDQPARGSFNNNRVSKITGTTAIQNVYHVVASSFKTFNDAEAYKVQMRNNGYDAVILYPKPGVSSWYRVSIARSPSKGDLVPIQNIFKSETKKKTWLHFEQ
ncbi:MAG: SPOR domain-containing protein [Bacteroidota bacterium]